MLRNNKKSKKSKESKESKKSPMYPGMIAYLARREIGAPLPADFQKYRRIFAEVYPRQFHIHKTFTLQTEAGWEKLYENISRSFIYTSRRILPQFFAAIRNADAIELNATITAARNLEGDVFNYLLGDVDQYWLNVNLLSPAHPYFSKTIQAILWTLIDSECTNPIMKLKWAIRTYQPLDILTAQIDAVANIAPNGVNVGLHLALVEACSYNQTETASLLLAKHADPNYVSGWFPLGLACECGNVEMVRLLLKHGANPNLAANYNKHVLNSACQVGEIRIVELLLAYKAKVGEHSSDQPLCVALEYGNFDVADLLLAHGADINRGMLFPDHFYSSLYLACFDNNLPAVTFLVERGAALNGVTTPHMACKHASAEIIMLLAEQANVNWFFQPDCYQQRPFDYLLHSADHEKQIIIHILECFMQRLIFPLSEETKNSIGEMDFGLIKIVCDKFNKQHLLLLYAILTKQSDVTITRIKSRVTDKGGYPYSPEVLANKLKESSLQTHGLFASSIGEAASEKVGKSVKRLCCSGDASDV